MPFSRFEEWSECGLRLCQDSPTLAACYFNASHGTLQKLRARHVEAWAMMGRRLYKGTWKSGTLACKFFDSSPKLVQSLEIEDLDRFVALDMPFRPDQRRANATRLRELMDRADVTIAEKYRQVMASYQDEVAIGRNIESYSGELEIAGATRTVDFLRIGRVLLAYQTLDREQTGYWDTRMRQWRALDGGYRRPVTLGIRIARGLAPPDILTLPIAAPVESE